MHTHLRVAALILFTWLFVAPFSATAQPTADEIVAKANLALAQEIGVEYKTWVEKGVNELSAQSGKATGKKSA